MFGREHPAKSGRLNCTQKETRQGQRKQFVQIIPANRGKSERGQSFRHLAQQLYTIITQREYRRGDNAANYNEESYRLILKKNFPKNQQNQRNSSY